jgi:AAA family ATP:ADP antiporter
MNTGRAMLWLPTSSDAKYKAKQAVDTFVVRFGDVLSALVVYAGLHLLNFEARSFAVVNLVVVCLWIPLALSIARTYERAAAARHDA